MSDDLVYFKHTKLSDKQRDILAQLGNPEVIGGATGMFNFVGTFNPEVPFLQPPYNLAYYCPVVMVAGSPRQITPSGDVLEVAPDTIGPIAPEWADT